MFNKIYEYIKKFIKDNIINFIIFIALSTFFLLPLPYYIDMPGGLLNTDDKIKIENEYKIKGSYNMTYVSEIKATPILYLITKLNSNWDLVSFKEVEESGLSLEEYKVYNRLLLDNANDSAISVAYKKANKEVNIIKNDFVVVHVDSVDTELQAGDKIKKIDNIEITDFDKIVEIVNSHKVNDILEIEVENESGIITKHSKVYEENGKKIIGIIVLSDISLEATPKYEYNFNKKESGPSGGLMMTLTIYNKLINTDLTKGLKISGTGAIDITGKVSSIGGVKYKLKGAIKNKANVFLVPAGDNYNEAIKLKEKYKYDIDIVSISNFDEAIEYLKNK